MKTIYVDSDFKCHLTDDGTMTAVETDFFDGKCDTFIEGHRLVPAGKCWTRSDGELFTGEMGTPWKPDNELEAVQRAYESALIAEYEAVIDELYEEVTAV